MPGIGPCGVFCVWQLPQATMLLMRYLPRSSGVCAAAVVANTATARTNAVRIIAPPYRILVGIGLSAHAATYCGACVPPTLNDGPEFHSLRRTQVAGGGPIRQRVLPALSPPR